MCTDAFQNRGVGASAWRMYASGLTHGLVFPDVYYTYILVCLILACTVVKKKFQHWQTIVTGKGHEKSSKQLKTHWVSCVCRNGLTSKELTFLTCSSSSYRSLKKLVTWWLGQSIANIGFPIACSGLVNNMSTEYWALWPAASSSMGGVVYGNPHKIFFRHSMKNSFLTFESTDFGTGI